MATNTTNYNLIKPDATDFYDIDDFNKNADAVDTALAGKAATTHYHAASNITSGTLPLTRGGTGGTTATAARSSLGAAPAYTYGTADKTAGTSSLTTGTLYFMYE